VLYSPITLNLTGQGDAQLLIGTIVSGNYFSTLGVQPSPGRAFTPEEDRSPGANPVAVISYGLWNRLYGADSQVTSKTIRLNGHEFQIVGVAPKGFQGLNSLYASDVWVPLMMYPDVFPFPKLLPERRAGYFSVVGRMKPGVGLAQADASMQALAQDLERQYPRENQGLRVKLVPAGEASIAAKTRETVASAGTLLMIISGLVLLIACVNVANLLLSRAAERNKEIAIRLAMGATRARLIRQLLTESVVLSAAGGIAGLVVARWARDILWSVRPPAFNHAGFRFDFDMQVLAYTFGISIFTGLLFGMIPALRATKPDLAVDLKERSGRSAPRLGRWNVRSLLVMEQVAFSLITLVAAGLFIRSMRNAGRIDFGFDAQHLATITYNTLDQGYSPARGKEFTRQVLERVGSLPNVDGVTISKDLPLKAQGSKSVILRGQDNAAAGDAHPTLANAVWPGYFKTLRMPLVRGRDFMVQDAADTPRVAVVNEAAANLYWPGEDPTTKIIEFQGENLPVQIIGVARNAMYRDLGEPPPAMIYLSMTQYYVPFGAVYVHSSGNVQAALAAADREIRNLDRNLVLQDETVETSIRDKLWVQRLAGQLLGVFGALALVLSTIGIYGVVSYTVQRRIREIGIRMALGATAGHVQLMVLVEAIRMVAVGVVAGLVVSLATSNMVKNLLLVVGPRDALTFVLVPAILTLVAIVACWIPAHQATQVQPAVALHEE
jgi:predicted permease